MEKFISFSHYNLFVSFHYFFIELQVEKVRQASINRIEVI